MLVLLGESTKLGFQICLQQLHLFQSFFRNAPSLSSVCRVWMAPVSSSDAKPLIESRGKVEKPWKNSITLDQIGYNTYLGEDHLACSASP